MGASGDSGWPKPYGNSTTNFYCLFGISIDPEKHLLSISKEIADDLSGHRKMPHLYVSPERDLNPRPPVFLSFLANSFPRSLQDRRSTN